MIVHVFECSQTSEKAERDHECIESHVCICMYVFVSIKQAVVQNNNYALKKTDI